jgi:hypothetical protein
MTDPGIATHFDEVVKNHPSPMPYNLLASSNVTSTVSTNLFHLETACCDQHFQPWDESQDVLMMTRHPINTMSLSFRLFYH